MKYLPKDLVTKINFPIKYGTTSFSWNNWGDQFQLRVSNQVNAEILQSIDIISDEFDNSERIIIDFLEVRSIVGEILDIRGVVRDVLTSRLNIVLFKSIT